MVIARGAQFLKRGWLFRGGLWFWLVMAGPAFASDPALPASTTDATDAQPESDRPAAPNAQLKINALSLGLVMLAGLIVGGAMFLALVVIWGNRARRLARRPLPPVAQRDELWFLKSKKDAEEAADRASSAASKDTDPEID